MAISPSPLTPVAKPPQGQVRRYLEVAAFVVVWMAVGVFFALNNATYQALGVALALVFQPIVARRPFAQLWVRSAAGFRFDRWTVAWCVLLVGILGVILWLPRREAAVTTRPGLIFGLLAMGAVPAAFALRATTMAGLRRALPSVMAGIVAGWGWRLAVLEIGRLAGVPARTSSAPHSPDQWLACGEIFVVQFLAAFLIEEVIFRGVLDTHASAGEKTRWAEFRSAVFVSVLWALYHLPIQGAHAVRPLQQLGVALHVTGIAIGGVPLAYCWRRSGTLVLPAALHAFGNAYVLSAWGS